MSRPTGVPKSRQEPTQDSALQLLEPPEREQGKMTLTSGRVLAGLSGPAWGSLNECHMVGWSCAVTSHSQHCLG